MWGLADASPAIYAAYLLGIAGFAYKFAGWTSVHSVFGGSLFFS
jgi:hypothetical protein